MMGNKVFKALTAVAAVAAAVWLLPEQYSAPALPKPWNAIKTASFSVHLPGR